MSKGNKTWVNDIPVEGPTSLQNGDIIKISDRLFRCEVPGDRQSPLKQVRMGEIRD